MRVHNTYIHTYTRTHKITRNRYYRLIDNTHETVENSRQTSVTKNRLLLNLTFIDSSKEVLISKESSLRMYE